MPRCFGAAAPEIFVFVRALAIAAAIGLGCASCATGSSLVDFAGTGGAGQAAGQGGTTSSGGGGSGSSDVTTSSMGGSTTSSMGGFTTSSTTGGFTTSSSTSSSTTSSSGASGSACDGTGNCSGCLNCADGTVCSPEEDACQNDPSGDCPLLETCIGLCSGDQFCITLCEQTFPGGVQILGIVVQCLACSCAQDCPPAPPSCP
jgi:hypothetical protein